MTIFVKDLFHLKPITFIDNAAFVEGPELFPSVWGHIKHAPDVAMAKSCTFSKLMVCLLGIDLTRGRELDTCRHCRERDERANQRRLAEEPRMLALERER